LLHHQRYKTYGISPNFQMKTRKLFFFLKISSHLKILHDLY
jgi:hypothetical protein